MRLTLAFSVLFILCVGTASGQNTVSITQSGSSNKAQTLQTFSGNQGPNDLTITQDGTGNEVEKFWQYGSGNTTTITQDGIDNVVASPTEQGPRRGGPNGTSQNGTLSINQDGSNNVVWDADQLGRGNNTDIDQEGDGNWTDIDTQYSGSGSDANSASIEQIGTNNAIGDKSGNRGAHQQGTNKLTVTQEGSGNRAGSTTLIEAGISSFGPNPLIGPGEQFGGRQSIVQAGNNALTLSQIGTQNVVIFVLQNGESNVGKISQSGDANRASLIQRGPDNYSETTQQGNGNLAVVTQDSQ